MQINFSPEQWAGIVLAGLLVLQGILKEMGKRRAPERGCLMGDEDHQKLKEGMEELLKIKRQDHDILVILKDRSEKR